MRNRQKAQRLIAKMKQAAAHPRGFITLELRGEIGRDVWAEPVVIALRRRPRADVHLQIDSIGGRESVAREIYQALRTHAGDVSAQVDGECCSAATWLLLGARHRTATAGSRFLLHSLACTPPPLSRQRWTAAQHRTRAGDLEKLDAEFAEIVARHTGQPLIWVKQEMTTEAYMNAREALKRGLIHRITSEVRTPNPRAVHGLAIGVPAGHPFASLARAAIGLSRAHRGDPRVLQIRHHLVRGPAT